MVDTKTDKTDKLELSVPESDTKDLSIVDNTDMVFALIYAVLLIWGVVLTLISI
jgi:hypothetical protein